MRTKKPKSPSFLDYMQGRCQFLRSVGKESTAQKYLYAYHKLNTFMGGKGLSFAELTSDLMIAFESWCLNTGNVPNTVSFYVRIIRSCYNLGVDEGIAEDRRPFRKVFTGNEVTVKRAIPISKIRWKTNVVLRKETILSTRCRHQMLQWILRKY